MSYWRSILRFFKKQAYTPDGHSIAKCERCLRLLMNNAGPRLIEHLNEEHHLGHDASIETMKWLSNRVYKEKLRIHEQLRDNRRG